MWGIRIENPLVFRKYALHIILPSGKGCSFSKDSSDTFSTFRVKSITVLQIRRDERDNFGIIFHMTPLKHMLLSRIRAVSLRQL